MNRLAFVLFAGGLSVAAPVTAQMSGTTGTDLVEAIKKSDGDKVIQILNNKPKGIVNSKDGDGNTGLIIAISRSDETWTGYLLNQGADPNLGGKGGDTPLIAAARVGFAEATRWLLGLGAKVDQPNRMGETPLIIAVQQRNVSMVRQLLDAGADPDRSDAAAGYSARDYAQRDARSRDILKLIDDKKPKATAAK